MGPQSKHTHTSIRGSRCYQSSSMLSLIGPVFAGCCDQHWGQVTFLVKLEEGAHWPGVGWYVPCGPERAERSTYCIPLLHSTGLWCMVVLASCPSVHLTLVLNWNPGHEDSVLIFNPTQFLLALLATALQTFSRKGNTKLMNHNSLVLCSHEFVRRLVGFGRGQTNMYLCRYLGNQRSSITLRKI